MNVAIAALVAATLGVASGVSADGYKQGKSGFEFKPIDSSADSADWKPTAPWKLPKGFTQQVVADELALNIYDGGRDDWHDMNTVNETGPQAVRSSYTTHELGFPDNQPVGVATALVEFEDRGDQAAGQRRRRGCGGWHPLDPFICVECANMLEHAYRIQGKTGGY